MALPNSLVQPFRQGQLTVGSGWRAYAAPFNQALAVAQSSTQLGPTIYDLLVSGKFTNAGTSAPAGWQDLGLVEDVKISPSSKIGSVMSGYRNAVRAKYRADVSEKFSLKFKEMGRTQLKLASGEGAFNLLVSSAPVSTVGPLSSSGGAPTAIGASGYIAVGAVAGYVGQPVLYVPTGSGALYPAGTYIVCDQDYSNQFGFVGDSGVNVFQGAVTDVDFIRKTSDYVATVKAVVASGGQDALILTRPFFGGGNNPNVGVTPNYGPTAGAKVQKVTGFATRGGGTTLTEWSCALVLDTIDGSQVLIYYPRIAPDSWAGWDAANISNANSLQTNSMAASFEAMAFDDPTAIRADAVENHVVLGMFRGIVVLPPATREPVALAVGAVLAISLGFLSHRRLAGFDSLHLE